MTEYEIDIAACRGRQQRLCDELRRNDLDLAIVTKTENVQWLAGPRFNWYFAAAAALTADGHLTLAAPARPEVAAADEVVTYEAQWHSTLRNDQRQACMEVLAEPLRQRARGARLGVEFSSFGRHVDFEPAGLHDVEPELYRLRRRKDLDELALIKKAIAATAKMYERARAIIEPGISELEVFSQLQAAAVDELGERLTATGNDYQCGSRGGPPNNRSKCGDVIVRPWQ